MQIKVSILSRGLAGGSLNVPLINGFQVEMSDLPALTGTPKQIEWAERIRRDAIDERGHVLLNNTRCGPGWLRKMILADDTVLAALEALNKQLAELAEKLVDKTSAAAWIDAKKEGSVLRMLRA